MEPLEEDMMAEAVALNLFMGIKRNNNHEEVI